MKLIRKLKDIKYNIKYAFQRAKKGYCDYDLFSIDAWFIDKFPKMLGEFAECTCGTPCNDKELKNEAKKMPESWLQKQRPVINKIGKKYDVEFNLNDSMCCWLLIILRMKHCFEMCDEWNSIYDIHRNSNEYEIINKSINDYKKEAFYLFEKWFFDLWW